jgi:hypothetical protein
LPLVGDRQSGREKRSGLPYPGQFDLGSPGGGFDTRLPDFLVGTRVYEPGAPNVWHAWVSIKSDGPSYGGTAKEDLVLVDQIILVKKITNQFQSSSR